MKQIVIIHGGDSFSTHAAYIDSLKNRPLDYERLKPRKGWKDQVIETFSGHADVLTPSMPNSANAQFDEWSIWFERILPFLGDDVRLVGHSLGAMFLAKYLQGHPLKTPVRQLVLVAAGYDDDAEEYGSFAIHSAAGLEKSAREIHLFHSEDDFVVPYHELDKFAQDLPTAHVHRMKTRNHFLDAAFPELIELLKQK